MEPWRYSGPDFWRMTFIKLPGRLYSGAASGCCWPTWTTLWPDERLKAWRDELAEHGVTLFILSNNRHESRPRIFAEALDVPYIGHAGKPKTASFFKAMERMKAAPEQTAIVGDQIFTDILGGSRAGVATILVRPIRLAGNPGRYLRYAVEVPFRLLSRGGEEL